MKLFSLLRTAILAVTAAGLAALPSARAETYPDRVIRMIVPFSAGGPIDLLGRPLADKLSAVLGQPVVVDNRPGANGIVAPPRSRSPSRTATRC